MKSLPSEQTASAEATPGESAAPRRGLWGYLRHAVTTIKVDLRIPLEGQEQGSRFGRIGARFRFLLARHGWKLVAVVVIYYLIRDTLLYIVLPYLFARQILG